MIEDAEWTMERSGVHESAVRKDEMTSIRERSICSGEHGCVGGDIED